MSILYADTSALMGAYLHDEPEHGVLTALLLDGNDVVITSELTRVEVASAATAAARARRIRYAERLRQRFDLDCTDDGPLSLLTFDAATVFPLARDMVSEHALRTLDALHLAVALSTATRLDDEIVLVTRDARQAAAAQERGLAVR